MLKDNALSLFQGFSKLSRQARFQALLQMGALTQEEVTYLESGGLQDHVLADKFIENNIGYFQLPLGVATYFRIDDQDYIIPLAVEETSIIAALSKTAKWIREQGYIKTAIQGQGILGQIQFAQVHDIVHFEAVFHAHKTALIQAVNQDVLASMVLRGGGAQSLTLRKLTRSDGGVMAVIHMIMDSCDAMGANAMNQALEYLKTPLENMMRLPASICILSNLNDQKITLATVQLWGIHSTLGEKIQEASLFAELDPYRATTHNKGIMNGIDAVAIATGNDWRAIEAGMHAYAARSGHYQALSQWRYDQGILTGQIRAPLIVGTVGGVTSLHPTARLCLNMLGVQSANELSRVMLAVGLVQNLGAIRALCTDGIVKGHMHLHIDNLILVTGATEYEKPLLKERLQTHLQTTRRVSLSHAQQFLTEIRAHMAS